nr:MAG TPA: Protein of unknown function (DUF551) [Caudoviricetes sp.]
MSDYISREAAIEKIREAGCTDCGGSSGTICGFCDFENAVRLVNGLPTADVEPVARFQEREKAVVQLRKKWQAAEMFICTMCGHFDHSIDGNMIYGNRECGEIVGYPCCKKFTPWIPASVRLPKELEPVNVVWVNHRPEPYYQEMKDVPQKATAVYYMEKWYWWSCVCEDLLAEYGTNETDQVDDAIEITHWMPLPEPPEEGGNGNG